MTVANPNLEWSRVETMLDGMLDRRYYTNHGPLARQLEAALCERLGAGHAVLATNPAIGLVMLLEALDLSECVLLDASTPAWLAQGVEWAGLEVRHCDVTAPGSAVERMATRSCVDARCAILLVQSPDGGVAELATWAAAANCLVGRHERGRAAAALIALPGLANGPKVACIVTDDGVLASRLSNIRSSYGAGAAVPVRRTANGRVSEAQAGLVLAHLSVQHRKDPPLEQVCAQAAGFRPTVLVSVDPNAAAVGRAPLVCHSGAS